MTLKEKMRKALLLQHLERRLMFCETEEEENYVRKELDKISPRDTGIVSDSPGVGVAVSGDLRQTDVAFLRAVLQNIDDVNAELDPIEQIGYTINFYPRSQRTEIEIWWQGSNWAEWKTGDDKSAFLELIRGYEPCTSSSI